MRDVIERHGGAAGRVADRAGASAGRCSELNASIRAARQERGELAGERSYATNDGERKFAPGDRIIFLENNRDLGVKNGMIGTVEAVEDGRLTARLDQPASRKEGEGRRVSVSMADYAAVDHGYATTIHKSQGATVDRSFVLASETMDRHLTYVAMTRHRDGAALYAGRDEFADLEALSARLSRSQAKETTLDYAERRGIAARLDVESEIEVSSFARGIEPAKAPEKDGRSFLERRAAQAEPAQEKAPEQRRESFLELARSILAQSEASSSGDGARQRGEPSSRVPAPDRDVTEAISRGKQAFEVERAVEDSFAAFKAEQAQDLAREQAREREAERLRLAEDARQRALAEAAQKLEQERTAQRERSRGRGMER